MVRVQNVKVVGGWGEWTFKGDGYVAKRSSLGQERFEATNGRLQGTENELCVAFKKSIIQDAETSTLGQAGMSRETRELCPETGNI